MKNRYILRLDDASEYMDISNWIYMEKILDQYNIKPIFGIIPQNEDVDLIKLKKVDDFWGLIEKWINKGWTPALHGYTHVFETNKGGINPINKKSEFAGLTYECQSEKIHKGYQILKNHNVKPKIFFAPAHTFDENTLKALKTETDIRVISDTISYDVYYDKGFYFVPQQSGKVRKLPFKIVTFCYHPNIMKDEDFDVLKDFLDKYACRFVPFDSSILKQRKVGVRDKLCRKIYFQVRKMRSFFR